jgi:hypothetical protein
MSNFKTQQLDVQDSSTNVSINVLPEVGHILPFAGPSNKIPAGWVLCDGTNSTPDLRGKIPGGISNVSVGSNQTHSHTFTHSLGAFNTAVVSDSANISSANVGGNSVSHSHGSGGRHHLVEFGNTGPANRSTGTQANVIGMNHTHATNETAPTTNIASNQNANHAHGYNAYSVNATTSNSHSHNISSSPTVNTQTLTHITLPSIFYVNFIMKV